MEQSALRGYSVSISGGFYQFRLAKPLDYGSAPTAIPAFEHRWLDWRIPQVSHTLHSYSQLAEKICRLEGVRFPSWSWSQAPTLAPHGCLLH